MSRQTPSSVRKRIGMALTVSDYIARALRGDDDEISRRIRASYSDVPKEISYDFNNPDDAERVKEVISECLAAELVSAELFRGKRESEETKARKATAKNKARVYYKEQRGKGYSAQEAWQRTARRFRKDYPDLYEARRTSN